MHFLVDAQLPPALCTWLRARGHEADHVSEVLGGQTSDHAIARFAERNALTLISKDEVSSCVIRPNGTC